MIFHSRGRKPMDLKIKINDGIITRVSNFKFLGLILNENLNWETHTKNIAHKISKGIGILTRLRHFLPQTTLLTLYHSLITSHLINYVLIWGQDSNHIYKLQKKAIRVISKEHYLAHTAPLFKKHEILAVPNLFELSLLKFYYKYMHDQLPAPLLEISINTNSHFHLYNTRNRHKLSTPSHRKSAFTKSITYRLIPFINTLEANIKNKIKTHGYDNVIQRFKVLILNSYSVSCFIKDCYPCLK